MGRRARTLCTTLRTAYGPPGSGLDIRGVRPGTTQDDIEATLSAWQGAAEVTKLKSGVLDSRTWAVILRTFPHLQDVRMSVMKQAKLGSLPRTILQLSLQLSLPLHSVEERAQLARFSALQTLSLTGRFQFTALVQILAVASCLTQLTHLSFSKRPFTADYPPVWGVVDLPKLAHEGVWRPLSALPKLARLHLGVPLDYQRDMPQVAPLTALTHLTLEGSEQMVEVSVIGTVTLPVMPYAARVTVCCTRPPALQQLFTALSTECTATVCNYPLDFPFAKMYWQNVLKCDLLMVLYGITLGVIFSDAFCTS